MFDIIFSMIGIPFVLLIMIILFPIVKLSSRGPFIYKSNRLGKNMKKYKMLKIRTMKVDAPDLRNADGSTFNSDNDPRVTKVGNFLRKTSLDELPQIFNVFVGSMSFIGPRPDLFSQKELYINSNLDPKKFDVRPGISGYAQVSGRNLIELSERNKFDVLYVEKMSFLLDVKIFFLTIFYVFKRKGVNKEGMNHEK